jgi:hypothetical protein
MYAKFVLQYPRKHTNRSSCKAYRHHVSSEIL